MKPRSGAAWSEQLTSRQDKAAPIFHLGRYLYVSGSAVSWSWYKEPARVRRQAEPHRPRLRRAERPARAAWAAQRLLVDVAISVLRNCCSPIRGEGGARGLGGGAG